MKLRRLLIVLLPGVAVAAPGARMLDRYIVDRVAAACARRAGQLAACTARPAASSPSAEEDSASAEEIPAALPAPGPGGPSGSLTVPLSRHPESRRHLVVDRATVERLIQERARPSGHAIAATSAHPGGIVVTRAAQLTGLLAPGDIITEVQGRSMRSLEDLVIAVGQAREAGVRVVTGRLWRRGEVWSVGVQPPW